MKRMNSTMFNAIRIALIVCIMTLPSWQTIASPSVINTTGAIQGATFYGSGAGLTSIPAAGVTGTAWTQASLTNLNQLLNGPGYITDDTSVPKNHLANSGALGFTWSDAEVSDTLTASSVPCAGVSGNGVGCSDVYVNTGGDTMSGNLNFTQVGVGVVGTYDATKTQAVWAMGPAYVLPPGGGTTTYGSFYGLGWSYNPDYGGAGNNPQSKAGLNHQLLLMMNGVTYTALGNGIWTSGGITGTTIDTGNGAMEVNSIAAYTGNQNLGTGNDVSFRKLSLTDDGTSTPLLDLVADDTGPWAIRFARDNMGAGGEVQVYHSANDVITFDGDDSITGLAGVTATTFTGALSGNAATASALAADPGDCSAGQAPTGINTAGTATGCTTYLQSEVDGSTANEIQTLGTSGTTITLTSGGSVTAPYATTAGNVASPDGTRNAGDKLPNNATARNVRFDFAFASTTGTGGNYAGVMTYVPWDGTTASTGDASYQLAFGSTAANGGGVPQLNIRKGIDSTWNSWYTIWHSGNDGSTSGLDADTLDGQSSAYYQPASTALTTTTSFGGDVSGTYGAIVVADNSHQHKYIKPYMEYTNYIANADLPAALLTNSEMGSGGLRVDFMNSNGATGGWATTVTLSGYNHYGTTQLAFPYSISSSVPQMYLRYSDYTGNSWGNWYTVWHGGNDGSGSGLDADTLDGYQWDSSGKDVYGSDMRTLGQMRATGWYDTDSASLTGLAYEIGVSAGEAYALSYSRSGGTYGDMNFAAVNFDFDEQGGTTRIEGNEVWHAGNDGSTSGLDADLLDGQSSAYYLDTSASSQTKSGSLTISGDLTVSGNAYGLTPTMYLTSAASTGDHNCDDVPSNCCASGYHLCTLPEITQGGRQLEYSGTGRIAGPEGNYGDARYSGACSSYTSASGSTRSVCTVSAAGVASCITGQNCAAAWYRWCCSD